MKNEALYDRRTIERKIHQGQLSRKEYEQYLSNLKDLSEKAVPLFSEDEDDSNLDEE